MSNTIREQIIQAVETRLSSIRQANGYNTNCGLNVERVRRVLDPENLPAVVIWPQPEEATKEYQKTVAVMPLKITGLALFGSENPSVISERILADLIECILGIQWTVSFTSGARKPAIGDTITGATSSATAYVTGVSLASGSWASSNAAGTLAVRRVSGTFTAESVKIDGATSCTLGAMTGTSCIENAFGNLAETAIYVSGGTDEYPEGNDIAVGASITVNVTYKTNIGNPYTQ